MSLRGLLGAIIGGTIGAAQFAWLVSLDVRREDSHLPTGDVWFWLFAFTWVLELVALMAIGMYKFAPWVTRILRDDFETYWILREKQQHYAVIVTTASLAVLVRAIVRALDAGAFTESVGLGLLFASLPFVIPRPKLRLETATPARPTD